MQYNFDWDPEKALSNRQKHNIGFEESASVFRDPRMLTLYDSEHSRDEDRWITLGLSSSGKLLVVCHTFREETSKSVVIRLISSRKATKYESQRYQSS